MALDAMWVVTRVAGLKIMTKDTDAKTRVGSKTAWMGTYYDDKGNPPHEQTHMHAHTHTHTHFTPRTVKPGAKTPSYWDVMTPPCGAPKEGSAKKGGV